MEHLTPEEVSVTKRQMGKELDNYEYKPYCRMKKMGEHRWGALRMWPKWKSVRKIWGQYEKEEHKTMKEAMGEMDLEALG